MVDTVGSLRIEINVDDGKVSAKMRGAAKSVKKFEKEVKSSSKSIRKMESRVTGLTAKMRDFFIIVSLGKGALHNIWLVTGGWGKVLVETNSRLERMMFLLEGMSKATSQIERAADAQKQFGQIVELALNAPFTIDQITNSWVKMKSVGIDPATGALKSLIDAVASFGGDDALLHRATVAIQQMAGKGVISMEELRQQLAEAVPSAMGLMARGLGKSVGAMVDEISKGNVQAKPALEALFAEFEKTFGGAAAELMKSFSGRVAQMQTRFVMFQKSIGDAGFFTNLKDQLEAFNNSLDQAVLDRWAKEISDVLVKATNAIIKTTKWLWLHWDAIKEVVKVWAAWKFVIGPIGAALAVFYTKWAAQMAMITAANEVAVTKAVAGNSLQAAIHAGQLQRMSSLRKSWMALRATMAGTFLLNPAMIFLAIAAAVVYLATTFKTANEKATEALKTLKDYAGALSDVELAAAQKGLAVKKALIEEKKLKLQLAEDRLQSDPWDIASKDAIVNYSKQIAELEIEVVEAGEGLLAAQQSLFERNAQEYARRQLGSIGNKIRTVQAEYVKAADVISEAQASMSGAKAQKDEVALAARKALNLETTDKYLAIIQPLIDKEKKLSEQYAKSAQEIAKHNEAFLQAKDLKKQYLAMGDAMDMTLGDRAIDTDKGPLSKIENFIANTVVRAEALRAKLNGLGEELIKFRTQVAMKVYDKDGQPPLQEFIDQGEAAAIKLDKIKASYKAVTKLTTDGEKAMKSLQDWENKAGQDLILLNDRMELGSAEKGSTKIRAFNRVIETLRQQAEAGKQDMVAFEAQVIRVQKVLSDSAYKDEFLKIQGEIRDSNLEGIINVRDRFAAEQAERAANIENIIAVNNIEAEAANTLRAALNQLQITQETNFNNTQPLQALGRQWSDVMGNMEQAAASWANSFSDALTQLVMTGKIDFKSFAKSIIKDLIKIAIQAQITALAMQAVGLFSGGTSKAVFGPTTGPGVQASGATTYAVPGYERGGVMGADGNVPLKKYARGGVASRPQLAMFGEGDQNEAYVPLPDGRSIPVTMSGQSGSAPNVTVNVINESGQQVDAESNGDMEFDGDGWITSVVLKSITRPGEFRDGMKQAMG